MREELKSELDLLFKTKNRIYPERRTDPRLREFEAHVKLLDAFSSVQDKVVRPLMESFGSYVESLGHRYFIESAQELIEGHKYPVSRIALHVLVNSNVVSGAPAYSSICFKMENTSSVYAVKKTGTGTLPVDRYTVEEITTALVEQNLKSFLIELVL